MSRETLLKLSQLMKLTQLKDTLCLLHCNVYTYRTKCHVTASKTRQD